MLREMLSAGDLVIVSDTQEEVQARVLQRQENLERGRLKIYARRSEVVASSLVRGKVV